MSCSTSSPTGPNGGVGGTAGAGGGIGPCGACKFLRRKCVSGCIFAPYFDSEQGAAHFAAVHKVFGASNVSKLLLHIPAHKRLDAVATICYEAQARLHDPVYGCVSHIFSLQQQVISLQAELTYLQAHLATLELPSPPPPPTLPAPQPFSISDLPSAPTMSTSPDLSALFNPLAQTPCPTVLQQQQQRQIDLQRQQFTSAGVIRSNGERSRGGGQLQELARELIDRHRSSPAQAPQISD